MDAKPKTWSGLFPIHPAADVFPMMTDAELDELGEDIKAHGLRNSVLLWQDNADSHVRSKAPYYVLDGRNRLAAMDRVGIRAPADWRGHRLGVGGRLVFNTVCAWVWAGPGGQWEKTLGVDPAAIVIGANIRRRHLSKEQQADLIVKSVQAGEEFLAKLARNQEAEAAAGRPKDPVKEKAVREGEKQGISKRTIERSLARQEDRPKAPRASRVEPLRAAAPPLPTETYEQKLEAKVARARAEVERAGHALTYWRGELREAERVLVNYRTKRAEASEEAA